MNLRIKHFIITGMVFIIVAGFFTFTASLEYKRNLDLEKQRVFDDLLMIQTSLENIITSRMISSNSLAAYAELNQTFTQEEYENFAKRIYANSSDVVHDMTFITDTTITHIYPYDENQRAIGVDLAQIDAQRDLILYAKDHLKSVFAAPVDLIEGGVGIIVRSPVLVSGAYYGQVAIVFNYENTLKASGILKLSEKYDVELSSVDPVSGEKVIIWTNASESFESPMSNVVNLYDSKLSISAMPTEGWQGGSLLFYILCTLGLIISITFALGVFNMFDINRILRSTNDELASAVGQLIASEEQLKVQYDAIIDQKNYIKYLAEHDSLTGLSNRRRFVEILEGYFKADKKGTIMLLDLDNFKNINDSLGHVYGDKVLISIAHHLENITNKKGHVFRFGGDEFFIMLPEIQERQLVDDITYQISSVLDKGIEIDGFNNHVTASIGLSKFPEDATTVEELMSKVDIAMYHAKRFGKNQKHFFNQDMISVFEKRVNIEKKIHDAIVNDGFMMYYQPIVDVRTGCVSSLEALIRMKDFSLMPDAFICVAEETMQIVTIGKWVIQEVLNQQLAWRERGYDILPVAINLSPKQISDLNLVAFIEEALKSRSLSSNDLEIEVTENVLIDKREENIKVLSEIKALGIKIALDDFGTGFSSLNYLTFMPVDKIKIDKSLKDKFIEHENQKVMEGLISLAHGLNLDVVVEGVEALSEVEKLIQCDCDFLQGYHYGRPASAKDVEHFLVDKAVSNEV